MHVWVYFSIILELSFMRYLCHFGVKTIDQLSRFSFSWFLAVTFLKHWEQTNAYITHRWDLMEFEEEEVCFSYDFYLSHLFFRIDLDQNLPYVLQQSKKILSQEFSNLISLLQHVDIESSPVLPLSVSW